MLNDWQERLTLPACAISASILWVIENPEQASDLLHTWLNFWGL